MNDESESDCDYMDLIEAYVDRFGDGPPVFGLDDEEAIAQLTAALESGEPMTIPDSDN